MIIHEDGSYRKKWKKNKRFLEISSSAPLSVEHVYRFIMKGLTLQQKP